MLKEKEQLNLNLIKFFIEAAESSSLAEVAKKTGYEISNVSSSITKLEKQLGVILFTRNPLKLTEIGEDIYKAVKKAYKDIQFATVIAKSRNNMEKGKISIGCPSHITNFFLMDKINKAVKDYKDLEITLDCESPCKMMLQKIKDNELQFALLDNIPQEDDINDFEIKDLSTSKYIFVAKDKIKIQELKELNQYKFIISDDDYKSSAVDFIRYLKKFDVELDIRLKCKTTETRINAAKLGLGIAYLIKDSVKEQLKNKELYEVELPKEIDFPVSTINVIYLKDRLTKVDKIFIKDYLCK